MQNRRDFLKTAALAALGSGLVVRQTLAGESLPYNINKLGLGGKMKMKFFPYELKLRHVFTVATYSRATTPDVQVEIEYEGITGYGEASMPPYLGETVALSYAPSTHCHSTGYIPSGVGWQMITIQILLCRSRTQVLP